MPRYQYHCKSCEATMTLHHLSDEVLTCCPECQSESGLVKLLSSFNTTIRHKERLKIGAVTEQFIKDARQELEAQKLELPKKKS